MSKRDVQKKVFDIAAKRDLTVGDVREAIIEEGNLALCKSANTTWCITEVDVFFPDDDYVTVTKEVAEQVISQDDVFHQTLEGIDIYRTI